MAKDKNTFAKRQRETLKRQKAEEKRERRKKRNEEPRQPSDANGGDLVDNETPAEPACST